MKRPLSPPSSNFTRLTGLSSVLLAKLPSATLHEIGESSWVIHVPKYKESTSSSFGEQWALKPREKRPLKMFGKTVYENHYSRHWADTAGVTYRYSGQEHTASNFKEESKFLEDLVSELNELVGDEKLNAVLQNWYEPDHDMGMHCDDEKEMMPYYPIFSLSWGGPRRFVLKPKKTSPLTSSSAEFILKDGDLLVMGGSTQLTHKHGIPKLRKKDQISSNRINWTVRAFFRQKEGSANKIKRGKS